MILVAAEDEGLRGDHSELHPAGDGAGAGRHLIRKKVVLMIAFLTVFWATFLAEIFAKKWRNVAQANIFLPKFWPLGQFLRHKNLRIF